ncbi:hypothetical protein F4859DRAFT_433448 [Xylaria cf. heliscus]|nr:hypothetical protein F4859DRAFT_433448 [Xylaria cf. heliscus]
MMETYGANTWTSNPNPPCQHSEGIGAPVCWDCAEGGHVRTPVAEGQGVSPSWQMLKKFRRSLGFRDGPYRRSNLFPTESQVSMLEVRTPEEGLEVGSPLSRRSQPGLILVTGPRVVSPEDKFIKPELKSWDSESTQVSTRESTQELTQKYETVPEPNVASEVTEKEERRTWGLKRRTFLILVVVAILTFAGLVIGIAVAVTQQNKTHSTSLSASSGGQVSSSSLPITATMTISYYVVGGSSTFAIPSETEKPSSSRQVGSVTALTGTPPTATGKGVDEPPKATIVAVTSTAFITAQKPPPTNTIPSQPTATAIVAPPPPSATTSQAPPPSTSSTSSRICLGPDGSTYTDPGTGDRFRIECAVTHEGSDIINLEAETMQQCVSLCAKNKLCKGAVWFNVGPQGTNLNYCWLKSAMDDDNVRDTLDAQSVVLL